MVPLRFVSETLGAVVDTTLLPSRLPSPVDAAARPGRFFAGERPAFPSGPASYFLPHTSQPAAFVFIRKTLRISGGMNHPGGLSLVAGNRTDLSLHLLQPDNGIAASNML